MVPSNSKKGKKSFLRVRRVDVQNAFVPTIGHPRLHQDGKGVTTHIYSS